MKHSIAIALLAVVILARPATHAAATEPAVVDFTRDVRPILERSCAKCHGVEKQKGGLRFDRRKEALGASDSGKKAIVPGKAGESELIRRVESADADERMPPKSDPLTRDEIKTFRAWIDSGANWPDAGEMASAGRGELVVTDEDRRHWAYRPLANSPIPDVKEGAWCQTPVDRFIVAALEERGLRPNPRADRRTLIRRVYFDMLGLPPAPEEVEAFATDPRSMADDELVEKLLMSPHYGERWGRHWLDVARYADSDGLESDADRPNAYHYRDFVIRALNDDLPYQTFVRWQLAGDEYEPDNSQALAATGFLVAAPTEVLTVPMEEEKLRLRFNELDDMAVATVSAFLGLTLGCARCHDHKFDAIPTRDYYRLQCALTTTARDNVILLPRAEAARYRADEAQWKKRLNEAQTRLNDWLTEQKKPHAESLRRAKINALPISDDEKKLLTDDSGSEAARKLANRHEKALSISDDDWRRVFTDEQRREWETLSGTFAEVQRARS